ncbi:MAG TPA: alginate lyase [Phycisphaerales bacterium]|nr:alginate lyase [Phycisphaerales bacterium]
MKSNCLILTLCISMLTPVVRCHAQDLPGQTVLLPEVVTVSPNAYHQLKLDMLANPARHTQGLVKLNADAQKAMRTPIRAATEKTVKGPSSDPHDYVSLSPYRWPNPNSADGMPWIRKDGKVNPMRDQYDLPAMQSMATTTFTLATGYYFLNEEQYAQRATQLIDMWFINPKTRMNPRILHGQYIPGKTDGQCYGILETARLFFVINAAGLLKGSPYWTTAKSDALKQWFTDYLSWLKTSDLGKKELAQPNNHSNWIIAQMMVFAMYVGDNQTAAQMCELAKHNIDTQIQADGSQPHELARTRSLDYSEFSLRALLTVAWLGQQVGSDLASYTSPQGGSLRKAIDLIAPHLPDPAQWPHKQIVKPKYHHFHKTLGMAQSLFPNTDYQQWIKQIPADSDPAQMYYHPPTAYQCTEQVN